MAEAASSTSKAGVSMTAGPRDPIALLLAPLWGLQGKRCTWGKLSSYHRLDEQSVCQVVCPHLAPLVRCSLFSLCSVGAMVEYANDVLVTVLAGRSRTLEIQTLLQNYK
jgi:hypothetical protein